MNPNNDFKGIYLILAASLFGAYLLQYLMYPSSLYNLPLIFLTLIGIIYIVFELRNYYNKLFYSTIAIVVLVVMLVMSLLQSIPSSIDKTIYYIDVGWVTLGIIATILFSRKWENNKEEIQ